MRLSYVVLTLCLLSASVVIADDVELCLKMGSDPILRQSHDVVPITPAEAAKKINEKVVVEMEVKSTGGRGNQYLNSEEDFNSEKNFTIFISKDHLDKFKKAGIESPSMHFKGKRIQVTGTVVLEKEKPWIKVEEPDQIKVVVKDKK